MRAYDAPIKTRRARGVAALVSLLLVIGHGRVFSNLGGRLNYRTSFHF